MPDPHGALTSQLIFGTSPLETVVAAELGFLMSIVPGAHRGTPFRILGILRLISGNLSSLLTRLITSNT